MSKLKNLTLIALFPLFMLASQGCVLLAGAAAGAGGYAYYKGTLERNLDKSNEQVHKATLKALKKLDLFIIEDEAGVHDSKTKAEYADGKSVTIKIKSLTERAANLKIRVGTFGDKEKSIMIFNAIKKQL